MSLNYEMARYTELTGEDGAKVSISRLGGYLDGYEKGRADQKAEDNKFFNFEGSWQLEKEKIRADVLEEYVNELKRYMETTEQRIYMDESNKGNDTYSAMPIYDYADELAEKLKEQKK